MADGEMVVDELTTDPLEALQELFTWAGRIPEAVPFDGMNGVTVYHDDGDGWISWPPHQTEMLDQGPAVARELVSWSLRRRRGSVRRFRSRASSGTGGDGRSTARSHS